MREGTVYSFLFVLQVYLQQWNLATLWIRMFTGAFGSANALLRRPKPYSGAQRFSSAETRALNLDVFKSRRHNQAKDFPFTLRLPFRLSLLARSRVDWHGELVNQWTDRTHWVEKPTGFVCPIGNCTVTGPTHGQYGYCNLQASARANTVNLIPIIVVLPVYIQHVY